MLVPFLACTGGHRTITPGPASAPALLLGSFQDDYKIAYRISPDLWWQLPGSRYHIVRWDTANRYLIARNDEANPADGGLWTRIDWIPLDMPPYTWAFCYSAYRAPSAAAAESVKVARPEQPRTGCNGFPFSRVQPVAP